MKALPWILAGIGIGAAVTYIVVNAPAPKYNTGDPDVDRFADKANRWGTKQQATGAGNSIVGKAKQAFGEVTGDYDTANEGAGDQTVGSIRNAAGKAANAVGDAVREFNR